MNPMTENEFEKWQAVTQGSRFHWTEDEIFRLNGRGLKYYRGGEDGTYVEIHRDGRLEIGQYGGAVPHIGEAYYQPVVRKRYGNFDAALRKAAEFAGPDFPAGTDHGQKKDLTDDFVNQTERPAAGELITANNISIDEELIIEEGRINAYVSAWFDVDARFSIVTDGTDDYANVYANYYTETGELEAGYTLIKADGSDCDFVEVELADSEREAILAKMKDAGLDDCVAEMPQKSGAPARSNLFSRVQLWTDNGAEDEFYMPGVPRGYDDLEGYSEFVDFTEFIAAGGTGAKEVTAVVTPFSEGGGEPRDADQGDIDRITWAAENGDVEIISSWSMGEKFEFTFDLGIGESPDQGMGEIQ